ncbi:Cerato-platanin [Morchella conica CCBAS932]|uniref:Cerato-platanin n=1 Tax=Morchella conica CCBAS932 TaxID=1392247 RepID=A0A3N4KLQ5_9PEZI|nr:Cerato-platanin [Morchella conica CCBAS932]
MQFSTILLTLVSAATSALAVTAAYDTTYDTSSLSTLVLACSDGVNGLYTKGYQTLGSVPGFPNVGAVETVAGWNSANCGKCYNVTYGSTTIKVTAVDHAASGFVLSLAALNTLTGGQGVALGRVDVTYTETAC